MRRLLLFLVLAVVVYVLTVAVVNAARKPVSHVWSGHGRSSSIGFRMPAGPFPGVLSNHWTLRYSVSCHGLTSAPGAPPGTLLKPAVTFVLTGGRFLENMGVTTVDSKTPATQTIRFGDGGQFTLKVTGRSACGWTVAAKTD